ncbi:MAG: ATP-binding cassette domain-containing protein [Bacteroidales bacterium]|nr:ATP-binding cassette domain-containing protein [Bacteroidales bacterium]
MTPLILLSSPTLYYQGVEIDNPQETVIPEGITAIIGPNASGKSSLANILARGWNFRTNKITSPRGKLSVKILQFSDIHSLSGFKTAYYQQRYESGMNDEVPTVGEIVDAEAIASSRWKELCNALGIQDVERKKINHLSSGELRKLLLVNALTHPVDLLILDNPYIGLDAPSRDILNDALAQLAERGENVALCLCNPGDIPASVDVVIPMKDMKILPAKRNSGNVKELRDSVAWLMDFAVDTSIIPEAPPRGYEASQVPLEMRSIDISLGDRMLIKGLSWTVRRGECWSLSGPNGSGKTTLLSLVHADNPKGYALPIALFDRERGSGETIWDIKRRIGYISPEMHLYFNGGGDVVTIVAQGLNDTVGLFTKVLPWQRAQAERWLQVLHIDHLADRRFNTLSTGEQRMVLLARAIIKQPELLILDEPLHGLDSARKRAVRAVINALALRPDTALIYVTHYHSEIPESVTRHKTLP